MSMKRGGGGRLQHYSSANGRYVSSMSILMASAEYKKQQKELEKRKNALRAREDLRRRAQNSKDPGLYPLFLSIENAMRGEIVDVNHTFYDRETHQRIGEADILTKDAFIEVKSGKYKGKTKQLFQERAIAEKRGLVLVVYAPDAEGRPFKIKKETLGFNIFRTKEEVVKYLRRVKAEKQAGRKKQ